MEFSNIEESNGIITEEEENGTEINEIEQRKVRLMRAFVEREDPSVKVPSFFLFFFFRSNMLSGFLFLWGLIIDNIAVLYLIMYHLFCLCFLN